MDKFISNKPFNTWRTSRHWKTLNTADPEFEEFKAGFPKIVYDDYRSRIGQKKKSERNRNDLFHFSAGVYQPKEAQYYLRHPEFLENHFNAQIFQFQNDSRTFMEKAADLVDDIATLNALSSNPVFPDNPSRQTCKIDCKNCEIVNCDCEEIAISQITQFDFGKATLFR